MTVDPADIYHIINKVKSVRDPSRLTGDTPLRSLGFDSLDMASALLAIEEKYGIKIADDEAEGLATINAIIAYLARL